MWKKLKTVHDTKYGRKEIRKINYGRDKSKFKTKGSIRDYMSNENKTPFVNYGRDNFIQLNLNLKDFDAKYTKDNQLRVGKKFYKIEHDLDKDTFGCIKEISEYVITQKSDRDIKDITSKLSEGISVTKLNNLNIFLAIFGVAAIFFASSESTITGNIISSGFSTTSNGIALTFCLTAIIVLTLYAKFKK